MKTEGVEAGREREQAIEKLALAMECGQYGPYTSYNAIRTVLQAAYSLGRKEALEQAATVAEDSSFGPYNRAAEYVAAAIRELAEKP